MSHPCSVDWDGIDIMRPSRDDLHGKIFTVISNCMCCANMTRCSHLTYSNPHHQFRFSAVVCY
jgi:hypothetical protein